MDPLIQKLPAEFIDRLRQIIPPSRFPSVLQTFVQKRPTSFRVNTLKADRARVLSLFQEESIKVKDVLWCRDAFLLSDATLRDLQQTTPYKETFVYVQGLSSMVPVMILAPQKGERILDLCAAPGGKTGQIAASVGNEAEVVAVEKIQVRFYKLLANIKLQQASCVKPVMMDGSIAFRRYTAYFDRVLLDAPCSSEGQFLVHEPRSFGYWRIRKVKEAAYKQKRLLMSALRCLKVGGVLVYSTCTFAPEENESNIDWALRTFPDTIEILPISFSVPEAHAGLPEWQGRVFHPAVRQTLRILPSQRMEGFYCACLRKTGDVPHAHSDEKS